MVDPSGADVPVGGSWTIEQIHAHLDDAPYRALAAGVGADP